MSRPDRHGSRVVALGALLVLGLLATAGDRAAGAPKPETLREKREALGEVRRQLEAAQARATAAKAREVSLLAELEEIDRTMLAQRHELTRLDQEIRLVAGDLSRVHGQRGEVAERTVLQEGRLLGQLQALDRLRRAPPAAGPLGELPAGDIPARARLATDLRSVIRHDLARLLAWEAAADRLDTRRQAADRVRLRLVGLRRAVDAERAALDTQAARRRALLGEVREDRATHERLAAELSDAANRLEALVQRLARRPPRPPARVAATRPVAPGRPAVPVPPAVGLGALRGRLPWPAEGRVLTSFGRQVHPRFGTETVRRGIDIAAPEGATVRAVHPGTVLHRGWLRGYGNLVVLDHGQDYYTVYAHLAESLVDDGDRVDAGQTVGRVGETGTVDGPRLYFEVRYQGRADDPQAWLRRRP